MTTALDQSGLAGARAHEETGTPPTPARATPPGAREAESDGSEPALSPLERLAAALAVCAPPVQEQACADAIARLVVEQQGARPVPNRAAAPERSVAHRVLLGFAEAFRPVTGESARPGRQPKQQIRAAETRADARKKEQTPLSTLKGRTGQGTTPTQGGPHVALPAKLSDQAYAAPGSHGRRATSQSGACGLPLHDGCPGWAALLPGRAQARSLSDADVLRVQAALQEVRRLHHAAGGLDAPGRPRGHGAHMPQALSTPPPWRGAHSVAELQETAEAHQESGLLGADTPFKHIDVFAFLSVVASFCPLGSVTVLQHLCEHAPHEATASAHASAPESPLARALSGADSQTFLGGAPHLVLAPCALDEAGHWVLLAVQYDGRSTVCVLVLDSLASRPEHGARLEQVCRLLTETLRHLYLARRRSDSDAALSVYARPAGHGPQQDAHGPNNHDSGLFVCLNGLSLMQGVFPNYALGPPPASLLARLEMNRLMFHLPRKGSQPADDPTAERAHVEGILHALNTLLPGRAAEHSSRPAVSHPRMPASRGAGAADIRTDSTVRFVGSQQKRKALGIGENAKGLVMRRDDDVCYVQFEGAEGPGWVSVADLRADPANPPDGSHPREPASRAASTADIHADSSVRFVGSTQKRTVLGIPHNARGLVLRRNGDVCEVQFEGAERPTRVALADLRAEHGAASGRRSPPRKGATTVGASSSFLTAGTGTEPALLNAVGSVVTFVGPEEARKALRLRRHETGIVVDTEGGRRAVAFDGNPDAPVWVDAAYIVDEGDPAEAQHAGEARGRPHARVPSSWGPHPLRAKSSDSELSNGDEQMERD